MSEKTVTITKPSPKKIDEETMEEAVSQKRDAEITKPKSQEAGEKEHFRGPGVCHDVLSADGAERDDDKVHDQE